jgi:hypothetical protein
MKKNKQSSQQNESQPISIPINNTEHETLRIIVKSFQYAKLEEIEAEEEHKQAYYMFRNKIANALLDREGKVNLYFNDLEELIKFIDLIEAYKIVATKKDMPGKEKTFVLSWIEAMLTKFKTIRSKYDKREKVNQNQ